MAASHRRHPRFYRIAMKELLWIAAAFISAGLWCTADAFMGESAWRPAALLGRRTKTACPTYQTHQSSAGLLVLHASTDSSDDKKEKKKSGAAKLDENVKNRLVKETIAPWRPLRLFLYFALGSGAMIGGLITLSGTLAAMSGARTDIDLNTEVRSELCSSLDMVPICHSSLGYGKRVCTYRPNTPFSHRGATFRLNFLSCYVYNA
jgi:Low psii accumulation1 / Rep27